MLLKALRLNEFRQFKGTQSVSFSTDPEKNVTIIMGENGSGKTTLAQAFTWCLYGDTDFDDKAMLCKATAQDMLPNDEIMVYVELDLKHNSTDYTIIRRQLYKRESSGKITSRNATFNIACKGDDGQQEFSDVNEAFIRMKEILPKELSKYFFFDGERIGNMSKEIKKGKSQDFAQAVKGLLGLNALIAAKDHLKARAPKVSVMRSYDESYDSKSDENVARYSREILEYQAKIERLEARLAEIELEESTARDKCDDLNERIKENVDSVHLAREKDNLRARLNDMRNKRTTGISSLVRSFCKNAPSYFAQRLISDALTELADADKLDKGIPDIHARTIEHLIQVRKRCICGEEIVIGNKAYEELNKLLPYILPQSIGTLIGQFVRECEHRAKNADGLFDDVSEKFAVIREFETSHAGIEQEISNIEQRLSGMENVAHLQQDLMKYENIIRRLKEEEKTASMEIGSLSTLKGRRETERNELTLKDESNRKIEIYKAYTQYMYDSINAIYTAKETETREKLERYVNEIFKSIYDGGLSLSIDEKYNIQIIVNDFNGYNTDVETSTAQSISVIFAFISGVIKMARENRSSDDKMLDSEPYPLVMDAPLSAFDKTRIRTVCDALPKIAEQVIIFIKDTDGEIAENNMGNKVGARYLFDKKNEFETYLMER